MVMSGLAAYGRPMTRSAGTRGGIGAVGTQSPVQGGLQAPGAVAPAGGLNSGAPMAMTPPPQLTSFTPQGLLQNYNQAYGQAKNANQQMYNNVLGGYQNLTKQVGDQYGQLNNNVLGAYNAGGNALMAGYGQQYSNAMNTLQGAGTQQTSDINSAYDAQGKSIQQGLVGSGLAGTTIAPTMAQGNQTQRQADLGRLNASLLQERLGTMDTLSGQALNAQAGLNSGQAGLASQLGQAQIGAQAGLGQNQLNFQERINQPYPDMNALSNTMMKLGASGYGGSGYGPGGGGNVSDGSTFQHGQWVPKGGGGGQGSGGGDLSLQDSASQYGQQYNPQGTPGQPVYQGAQPQQPGMSQIANDPNLSLGGQNSVDMPNAQLNYPGSAAQSGSDGGGASASDEAVSNARLANDPSFQAAKAKAAQQGMLGANAAQYGAGARGMRTRFHRRAA